MTLNLFDILNPIFDNHDGRLPYTYTPKFHSNKDPQEWQVIVFVFTRLTWYQSG